jgi:hypothetical protein
MLHSQKKGLPAAFIKFTDETDGEVLDAKNKGKRFELRIARLWEKIHGGIVKRSRTVNIELDNEGVDLVGTDPFLIQCKAVERNINYMDILERMPNDGIRVVVHKRNNRPIVVALYLDDFMDLTETYLK